MSRQIPGVFLGPERATRLYHIAMAFTELRDLSLEDATDSPLMGLLEVLSQDLFEVINSEQANPDKQSAFRFFGDDEVDDFRSALKHLQGQRKELDLAVQHVKEVIETREKGGVA